MNRNRYIYILWSIIQKYYYFAGEYVSSGQHNDTILYFSTIAILKS